MNFNGPASHAFRIGESCEVQMGRDGPWFRCRVVSIPGESMAFGLRKDADSYGVYVPLVPSASSPFWQVRADSMRKLGAGRRECDRLVPWSSCDWRPFSVR